MAGEADDDAERTAHGSGTWSKGMPTKTSGEKKALRDAEDELSKVLDALADPMHALLYTLLYHRGWRISTAEDIVRRKFSTARKQEHPL